MVASKGTKTQSKVENDAADRIATALEQMVEKLGSLEVKIEELTYELQAHGNMLADAMTFVSGEEEEAGCGTGTGCGASSCGATDQPAQLIQIEK